MTCRFDDGHIHAAKRKALCHTARGHESRELRCADAARRYFTSWVRPAPPASKITPPMTIYQAHATDTGHLVVTLVEAARLGQDAPTADVLAAADSMGMRHYERGRGHAAILALGIGAGAAIRYQEAAADEYFTATDDANDATLRRRLHYASLLRPITPLLNRPS